VRAPGEQERTSSGEPETEGAPAAAQARLNARRRHLARHYARQLAALSRLEADGCSVPRLLWAKWLVETGRLSDDLPRERPGTSETPGPDAGPPAG